MCHAISARWLADNCPAISVAIDTSVLIGITAPGLSATMVQASAQSRSLIGSGASTLVMVVCISGCIAPSLEGQQRHDLLRVTAVAIDCGCPLLGGGHSFK